MLIKIYIGILIVVSLITFVLYGVDKSKARRHAWRIPEKILLGFGLLGGAVGGLLGMNAFHHKTKHGYFWVVNILGLIIQAALFYLIIYKL
jgi:uncharacterized membrane protein YsdA (DUF1294 family)